MDNYLLKFHESHLVEPEVYFEAENDEEARKIAEQKKDKHKVMNTYVPATLYKRVEIK